MPGLDEVRRAARGCRACSLWKHATQAVFGEGPVPARLMLVGEQPGDREDIQGRSFVGPAGTLLDRALQEAGVDRSQSYVTNAVKHFKFVVRGKRRLHQNPAVVEVDACRSWLERELGLVDPEVVEAMGATAARVLFRREMRINRSRGQVFEICGPRPGGGRRGVVTAHPSCLLRMPDERAKAAEYARFVADLALAQSQLAAPARPGKTSPSGGAVS